MTLPARAAFVMQEYRYESDEDTDIKATYPNAVELVIETELSLSVAATIGAKVFDVVKTFAEAYEVVVEGVYTPEILDGTPPQFTLDVPEYETDARIFRTVSIKVDWMNNLTTFVIRG